MIQISTGYTKFNLKIQALITPSNKKHSKFILQISGSEIK
uniref:Predicted protein n=1 Tax=Hordeum vulgare subsp. vulgare TaxID=112509 RepID=F2DUA0_HORVV|nr:predicted protein [Hordeum vulgare subsp. vulgare]